MKVLDEGHIYELKNLNTNETQILKFIKRSGGAIQYDKEYEGTQTQEVLRALIDRSIYLNSVIPCTETQDAIYYLRMVLYMYEVRAYRRKQEKVNRKLPNHDDTNTPKMNRAGMFDDIPFNEHEIEKLPIDKDGHIIF